MEWQHVEKELSHGKLISSTPLTEVLKAVYTKVDSLSRSHSQSQLDGLANEKERELSVQQMMQKFSAELNEMRNHMKSITEEKIELEQQLNRELKEGNKERDLIKNELDEERQNRLVLEAQLKELQQNFNSLKSTVEGQDTPRTPNSARKMSLTKIVVPSVTSEGRTSRPGSAKSERSSVDTEILNALRTRIELAENDVNELRVRQNRTDVVLQKKLEEEHISEIHTTLNSKTDTNVTNGIVSNVEKMQHDAEQQQKKSQEQIDTLAMQIAELEENLNRKAERKELQNLMEKLTETDQINNSIRMPEISSVLISDEKQLAETFAIHTNQLKQLMKTKADKVEVYKEFSEKSEAIDRLEQVKADSNIVARKAEREYVDSTMDKNRREIESMINSTNANTADLFAKDLEYLKILIDEKSSIKDLRTLRDMLLKSGGEKSDNNNGEALAGKMRCLSCNQELVQGMRSRPTSMSFTGFMSEVTKQNKNQQRLFQKKTVAGEVLRSTRTSPTPKGTRRPYSSGPVNEKTRPQTAGSTHSS
jgi:myosin heavy subunit